MGQTTQPRTPETYQFPTTVICRDNPYDVTKLNQSGLPENFFHLTTTYDTQVFPDLNQTWNNVTMSLGHTLEIKMLALGGQRSNDKHSMQI